MNSNPYSAPEQHTPLKPNVAFFFWLLYCPLIGAGISVCLGMMVEGGSYWPAVAVIIQSFALGAGLDEWRKARLFVPSSPPTPAQEQRDG